MQPTVFDRIRARFFYSNSATGITVVSVFLLAVAAFYLVDWGILSAFFVQIMMPATKRAARAGALSLKSGG